MSLLARYLAREILGGVALVLSMLVLLFVFLDLVQEMGDLHPPVYTLPIALLHILLGLPNHIHEMLPVSTVVGALLAFARLSASSEFNVMRVSGLSVRRLIGYMVALGLFLGAVIFALGEFIVPLSDRAAQQLKVRATTGVVAEQFRSGLWAKDGNTFINIQEMLPDTTLINVRMYTFDDNFRLKLIRLAERANWRKGGWWDLRKVVQTEISAEGTRVQQFASLPWRSDVNPDLLAVLMVSPDEMSARALFAYVDHLRENKQRTTRYEIALWNKLSLPLAAPVMLLLALPFVYQQPRTSGVSGRVLAGIFIGLGFYLFNRLFGHLGLLNDWPPALSAFLGLAVFAGAAVTALIGVERR
jgi:lipopolysaccharide export system permease protein